MSRHINPDELKQAYQATCYNCKAYQWIKPSIPMEHGINTGAATCKKCKANMHIMIVGGKLITEALDQHVDEFKKGSK